MVTPVTKTWSEVLVPPRLPDFEAKFRYTAKLLLLTFRLFIIQETTLN